MCLGQCVTQLTDASWQKCQRVFGFSSLCHVLAQVWCWFMQSRLSAAPVWAMVASKEYSLCNSMCEASFAAN